MVGDYDRVAFEEMTRWRMAMKRKPSLINRVSRKFQTRINEMLPEKVHRAITSAIKQMMRAVLFGTQFVSKAPLSTGDLQTRETKVLEQINFFSKTAAAEGAVTGAGGILLGLADFPMWLTIKTKMLFEIATLYGFDVQKYEERIFILYVFELTFSSQKNRNSVFSFVEDWNNYVRTLPADINEFDWRSFQQEYRDFIDLAKLLQLVPGIGAPVGLVVNHRLTRKLGKNAMNAYRLRLYIDKTKSSGLST